MDCVTAAAKELLETNINNDIESEFRGTEAVLNKEFPDVFGDESLDCSSPASPQISGGDGGRVR